MITLLRGIAILGCIDYSSSRGTKFSSYTQILTVSFYNFNILYSAVFRVFSFFKKKNIFKVYSHGLFFRNFYKQSIKVYTFCYSHIYIILLKLD